MFVHFEGKRSADIAPSRFGLRSIVAKEVRSSFRWACLTMQMEAEAIRKADAADPNALTSTTAESLMSAYRQTAGEVGVGKDAPAFDFFGRAVVVAPTATVANESQVRPAKRLRIAYKHTEGYSNAVKLSIRVSELFASSSLI